MPDVFPERILSTKAVSIVDPNNSIYPFKREVRFTDGGQLLKDTLEDFKRIHDHWKAQGNLRSRLQQWQSDSEGIAESSDFPWPGASSIVKPIIETRQNIIHAFVMSLVRPNLGKLFSCSTSFKATEEERTYAKKLAAYFNLNREFSLMWLDSFDEAFWALLVDGTVGRICDWKRKVEKRWERKTFNTIDDFLALYNSPDLLGISEDKYLEYLTQLQQGRPLSLDLEHDVVTVDRPDIDMDSLKDLVIYPITTSRQERTRFIGRIIRKRKAELVAGKKYGLYNSNVDEVIAKEAEPTSDMVDQQRNAIEGINEPVKKEDYTFIHGRYNADLDGDGIEEKYLVTYCIEAQVFIQFDRYPFWHNEDFIQLSWFKRRPKRMLGRGVAEMLSDIQLEASIHARFRINSNAISNAPMFMMLDTLKDRLDPLRKPTWLRPGGVAWIPTQYWQQKPLVPIETPKRDFGDSQAEEAGLQQTADNLLGASELRSGRETPNDPRAPAAKTALLIQQSGVRLDDFVFGVILRENKLLDIAKKLYYQFGPDVLNFEMEQGGAMVPVEIDKSWFNSENIQLQLSVTSLLDNPDYLKQRWEEFYARYGPEPLIGAIPQVRWEILNQILLNTPEAQGKKLLLPLEALAQMGNPGLPTPSPQGGGQPGINPTLEKSLAAVNGTRR